MDCIWMKVTKDEYELPLAVADSSRELAEILGLKPNTINEEMSRARKRGTPCCYRVVKFKNKKRKKVLS